MTGLPLTREDLISRSNAGESFEYFFFWGHTPPKDGGTSKSCLIHYLNAAHGQDEVKQSDHPWCIFVRCETSTALEYICEQSGSPNPRVLMLRLVFEFLLQQNYFGAAAMMVAEHLGQIHRIEAAESSGNLSAQSLGTASVIWQQEVSGFKNWYGCSDDRTITIMLRELKSKGMQQFVADLAVELQLSHPMGFEQ